MTEDLHPSHPKYRTIPSRHQNKSLDHTPTSQSCQICLFPHSCPPVTSPPSAFLEKPNFTSPTPFSIISSPAPPSAPYSYCRLYPHSLHLWLRSDGPSRPLSMLTRSLSRRLCGAEVLVVVAVVDMWEGGWMSMGMELLVSLVKRGKLVVY
jgi:hypothetical protein